MKFTRDSFYLDKANGDMLLVELFDTGDESVTLMLGDLKLELDRESALDLAERLMFISMEQEN